MPEAVNGKLPDNEEVTLLVDGDVIAFRAAAGVQHTVEDSQGFVQPFANLHEGTAKVDNLLIGLMMVLKATHLKVYLSDPESNWRTEIDPEYKANRKESVRPLLLGRLKEYLRTNYGATHWAGLEADDVLGILATSEHEWGGRTIIVGKDKDFHTFPGLHHQIGDRNPKGEAVVREVSKDYAAWFHLCQTLAGDRVDGYTGCPGIGMARAKEILADPKILLPVEGVITRGPRKGQATTKWVGTPAHGNLWQVVVSNYLKAGLTEEDALRNARLARILQRDNWDPETQTITLWVPPKSITGGA